MKSKLAVLFLSLVALLVIAIALGGGLDSLAGQSFASKAEALSALEATQGGNRQEAKQSPVQKQAQEDRQE